MLKTARYWRKWQKSVIINKKEKLLSIQSTKSVMKCVLFHLWLIIPCAARLRASFAVKHVVSGVAVGLEMCLFLFILVLVPWHYTIDCASWGVAWEKYEMIGAARGPRQPLVKECRPDAGANGHWQVCRHESDALCWCWHLQQDMFTIHEDVNRPWDSPLIVSRAIHCDLKVQYRLTEQNTLVKLNYVCF